MSQRRRRRENAARQAQILQRYERQRARNRLAVPGIHPYVLVLDGLKAGFNVPKIFRSALAMGARAIYLVGIGPFDPAPAKGAFRKVPARFCASVAEALCELQAQDYHCFALSPTGQRHLTTTPLPRRSAFVFGHEKLGLSFRPENHAGVELLAIPQCGAAESLNVSVAASIVMYEYIRQHGTTGETFLSS